MIFAGYIDPLLSYKLLRPLLGLCIKDRLGYKESFRLNPKERVMRWLRKQIWGKRDFLMNIEDDTYEQVIFIQMWNFTTSYR